MINFKKFLVRKQKGIGLLELMLSLAIIAILLIMATRYYLVTSMSQKVDEAIGQLSSIEAAAANYRVSKTNYTDVTQKTFCEQGMIPAKYCSADNSTLMNPWGDTIEIAASSTCDKGSNTKLCLIATFTLPDATIANNLANKFGINASVKDTNKVLVDRIGGGAS